MNAITHKYHSSFLMVVMLIAVLLAVGILHCRVVCAENDPACISGAPEVIIDGNQSCLVNANGEFIMPYATYSLELYKIDSNLYCVEKFDTSLSAALCDANGLITGFDYLFIDATPVGDYPILAGNFDGENGFIDANGKWVIPPSWYYAEPFSEGLVYVQDEQTLGFIDRNGNYVLQYTYDEMLTSESFSEGRAAACFSNGFWGYIDQQGNIIVDSIYIEAYPFSCGVACVEDEQGYTYIDSNGNIMSEVRYAFARNFEYGYAVVGSDRHQVGLISTAGVLVYPTTAYSVSSITPDHLCWINADGNGYNFRLYDLQSEAFLCSEKYEMPTDDGFPWNDTSFIVKKDGLYGQLSKEGQLLLPCQYEFLYFDEQGKICGQTDCD